MHAVFHGLTRAYEMRMGNLSSGHLRCYLRALYLMKASADQVAVLEDSATGACAGVVAGVKTMFWPQGSFQIVPNGSILVLKTDEIQGHLDIADYRSAQPHQGL